MNARELRLGNFVYSGVKIVKVKSIHTESVLKNEISIYIELNKNLRHYCVNIEEVKPIQLTEEILLKCGFEKIIRHGCDRYLHNDLDFEVERQGKYFAFCIWNEENPATTNFIMHSEYLHIFQNNFLALTNKELEIKL